MPPGATKAPGAAGVVGAASAEIAAVPMSSAEIAESYAATEVENPVRVGCGADLPRYRPTEKAMEGEDGNTIHDTCAKAVGNDGEMGCSKLSHITL